MEEQIKIIAGKIDSILDKVTEIDNKRIKLVDELKDFCPIKEGDKVSIVHHETKKHIRFAFVNKIEINVRGKERKARIEFDLQKCKSDGTKSQHADSVKYGEYIKRIS